MKNVLCLLTVLALFTGIEARSQGIAKLVTEIKSKGRPKSLALSPDGETLAATWDDSETIKLWDTQTGQLKVRINSTYKHSLLGFASYEVNGYVGLDTPVFSPDSRVLVVPDYSADELRFWDVATGKMDFAIKGLYDLCYPVFSPDGHLLALPSGSHGLNMLDVATHKFKRWRPANLKGVYRLIFERDGQAVWVNAEWDGKPRYSLDRVDLESGEVVSRIIPGENKHFYHALSPDGQTIATRSDHEVKLWKAATGELLAAVGSPKSYVGSLSFSPDSQWWVTGNDSGLVRLWKKDSAVLIASLEKQTDGSESLRGSVKFSPDGGLLVTITSEGLNLRDPATGKLKQLLKGARLPFTFSSDGSMLAAASKHGSILLWRVLKQ
jgi:WD40 repeat protein